MKQEHHQNEIVRMLNEGYSHEEIFFHVEKNYSFVWSKQAKQSLADLIAQIDSMNLFVTGVVPKKENLI